MIEPLKPLLKRIAYEHVSYAIQEKGGDRIAAARELRISVATLYRIVKGTKPAPGKLRITRHPKPPRQPYAPYRPSRTPPAPPPTRSRRMELVKYAYHQRKAPKLNVNSLLRFFLGRKAPRKGVSMWYENRYELESIFKDAHAAYLREIRNAHPDTHLNSHEYVCQVTEAWRRLRRMFRDHGVG